MCVFYYCSGWDDRAVKMESEVGERGGVKHSERLRVESKKSWWGGSWVRMGVEKVTVVFRGLREVKYGAVFRAFGTPNLKGGEGGTRRKFIDFPG